MLLLKNFFLNVRNGSVVSGMYLPGKKTTFYNGNEIIGFIKNDDFGKLFFGIWLSKKTSEPKLRRALLRLP
ncbi:chalcone isomerase family protein [Liberibacter crescens]|uniref:chalcone isomerase family protein n=1 Tax=Liberibacter crescens TaxID=1273132 RepID=UPI000686B8FE|nr:chalcone isomerase family protein [Liberibacter crescens]